MDELLYQLFHVVLVIRIGCKIIANARLQNKFNFKFDLVDFLLLTYSHESKNMEKDIQKDTLEFRVL